MNIQNSNQAGIEDSLIQTNSHAVEYQLHLEQLGNMENSSNKLFIRQQLISDAVKSENKRPFVSSILDMYKSVGSVMTLPGNLLMRIT